MGGPRTIFGSSGRSVAPGRSPLGTTEHERGQCQENKSGGKGCSAEVGKSPHARYYSLTRSSRSVCGGSEERRPPHPPRLLTPWGSNKSEENTYIIIGSEPLVRWGFALGYRFVYYILCASHKPPRCREKGVPRGCVAEGVRVRVARGARPSFRRSRAAKWGCAEGARVQRKTVCRVSAMVAP